MLFTILKILAIMACILVGSTSIFVLCILLSSYIEDCFNLKWINWTITIVIAGILSTILSVYITIQLWG